MNDGQIAKGRVNSFLQTRSMILEQNWLEFLRWVKVKNDARMVEVRKAVEAGGYSPLPKMEVSEINFWHWYIDEKMEDESELQERLV